MTTFFAPVATGVSIMRRKVLGQVWGVPSSPRETWHFDRMVTASAGTQVTDAGIVRLKGLTQLRKLDIILIKVTPAAVKRLHAALPNCTIVPYDDIFDAWTPGSSTLFWPR